MAAFAVGASGAGIGASVASIGPIPEEKVHSCFPTSQREAFQAALAPRLVQLLQICAGHVPGVSAMDLLTLLRWPENPMPEEP